MKVIDIHSHLGNLLYEGGGNLIFQKGVQDRSLFDSGFRIRNLIDSGFYAGLLKYEHKGKVPNRLIRLWATWSGRSRNEVATLENMQRSLDGSGVDYACCLPVPPNVTFDDIMDANKVDSRVIPFTGVDYVSGPAKIENDVRRGAKGMKLHPILQNVELTDKRTYDAVEAFAPSGLPILFHCGIVTYYLGDEKESPSYGDHISGVALVKHFKTTPFIIGHGGINHAYEVMDLYGGLDNAFVDISFQSPSVIKGFIDVFGSDKVLYASDWPYGDRKKSMEMVHIACDGDKTLEEKIFYRNSMNLLR